MFAEGSESNVRCYLLDVELFMLMENPGVDFDVFYGNV